jgi:hypothetical protein
MIEINVDVLVTMITMENSNNMTCLFVEKKWFVEARKYLECVSCCKINEMKNDHYWTKNEVKHHLLKELT